MRTVRTARWNLVRTLVAAAAFAGGVLIGAGTAAAAPSAPACSEPVYAQSGDYSEQDIDGDAYSDVVVGVPDAAAGGLANAGVVDVHYPQRGRTQRIGESYFPATPAPAAGDRFGESVVEAHFDGDAAYCLELAIGAPGTADGTGSVILAKGSNSGVSTTGVQRFVGQQQGSHFGAALAVGAGDLWIGAPDQTVDGQPGAGAIYHYSTDSEGQPLSLVQVITEDTSGVAGTAEAGDHFGAVVAGDQEGGVVVGEPDAGVNGVPAAGAVLVIGQGDDGLVDGSVRLSQASAGVYGTPEADDHFGASVSDNGALLAVGVPDEDNGSIRNAGMVELFDAEYADTRTRAVAATPLSYVTQESPTIPGGSETGDRFGAAVMVGQTDSLWIGAPGESIGDVATTGDVIPTHVSGSGKVTFFGHAIRLGGAGSDNIPGSPQPAAHVGTTLGLFAQSFTGSDNQPGESIVVGVPNVASGAGELWISDDLGGGYGLDGAGLYRDSSGSVAHEHYGSPAGSLSTGGFAD